MMMYSIVMLKSSPPHVTPLACYRIISEGYTISLLKHFVWDLAKKNILKRFTLCEMMKIFSERYKRRFHNILK